MRHLQIWQNYTLLDTIFYSLLEQRTLKNYRNKPRKEAKLKMTSLSLEFIGYTQERY